MDKRQPLINDRLIWDNASDEHFMTKPTRSQLERAKEEKMDISGKKGDWPALNKIGKFGEKKKARVAAEICN